MSGDDNTSRNADLDDRVAQVKRLGMFVLAALVFLPRALAISTIVLVVLVYTGVALFS